MTIEEKAKAYDEALETAKRIISNNCTEVEKLCLKCIFPQLKESEEERIRAVILKLILDMRDEIFTSADKLVTKPKVLAWLEKHKESLYISETCKENTDSFTNACKDVIVAIEKYLDWLTGYPDYAPKGKHSLRDMLYCLSILEKQKEPENVSASTMIPSCWAEEPSLQKEQKPVEPSNDELKRHQDELYDFKVFAAKQAREHHISFVHDFEWNNFCAELLFYFNEKRKPAEWSEKDENELNNILAFVKNEIPISGDTRREFYNWLKSLPERFNIQPKQEWSEEDESHLKWLCRIIHSHKLLGKLSLEEESELGKWIDKWINHEQQHEKKWSEFDEDCLKRAIWYVENPAPSVVKDTNLVLWLKSLRPQPQGIYQQVVKGLRDMCDRYEQNGMFTDGRARDFLGNVRVKCKDAIECTPILDEPYWKPTKAMLDALNWARSEFHPDCPDTMANLTYLYKELEQLYMTGIEYMNTVCPTTSAGREPNREDVADAFEDGIAEGYKLQWKPSEEQMRYLLAVINEPNNAGSESCHIILKSLYHDLQKLL